MTSGCGAPVPLGWHRRGRRAEKLRKQGGCATNSPVFWEYVDEGERWEDTTTGGLGL